MLPIMTFEGTIVADPELRFTPTGIALANFTIVANDRKRAPDGSWEDGDATFIRVTAWRQLAENVVNSLHKGDRAIVVGKLKQNNWEDNEGKKRSTFEIMANNVAASMMFAEVEIKKIARDKPAQPQGDPWATQSPAGTQQDPWANQASDPPF